MLFTQPQGVVYATSIMPLIVLAALPYLKNADAQSALEKLRRATSAQLWNASELIDQKVCTLKLDVIGKVNDLTMTSDGKIAYAIVSFEPLTKNAYKLYAVPLEALIISWRDDKVETVRIDATEDTLKRCTAFDKGHRPLFADSGFVAKHDSENR